MDDGSYQGMSSFAELRASAREPEPVPAESADHRRAGRRYARRARCVGWVESEANRFMNAFMRRRGAARRAKRARKMARARAR